MLNYIASTRTSTLIQKICDKQNILVLYQNEGITNINKYLKEAKVNFNLIKYFIIEINCLEDKEDEIIESIYNFSRVFNRIRFIILAQVVPRTIESSTIITRLPRTIAESAFNLILTAR